MTGNGGRGPYQGRIREDAASGLPEIRELVDQNFREIGRADSKATVLLATATSLLGILLATRAPTGWTTVLWWTAVAGSAGAQFALLLAVLPRRSPAPRDGPRTLAYFEDVLRAGREARLSDVVRDNARAPKLRLLRALEGTSRIAHTKNTFIRWSVVLLVPAVTASLGVLPPH